MGNVEFLANMAHSSAPQALWVGHPGQKVVRLCTVCPALGTNTPYMYQILTVGVVDKAGCS